MQSKFNLEVDGMSPPVVDIREGDSSFDTVSAGQATMRGRQSSTCWRMRSSASAAAKTSRTGANSGASAILPLVPLAMRPPALSSSSILAAVSHLSLPDTSLPGSDIYPTLMILGRSPGSVLRVVVNSQ